MTAASRASFDVHYGLAVHRPRPLVKLVCMSTPLAKPSWTERLMGMGGRAIGNMVSAWDGIDDPFGPESDNITPQEDNWRRHLAREEANRRQDELNARLAAERHKKALDELTELEGYGTF